MISVTLEVFKAVERLVDSVTRIDTAESRPISLLK